MLPPREWWSATAAEASRTGLLLAEVNWIGEAEMGIAYGEVQVRARHAAQPARVELIEGGRALVAFSTPVASPARGQAAVCYSGDRVLGGGWIVGTN